MDRLGRPSRSEHRLPNQDLPVWPGSLQSSNKTHSNGRGLLGALHIFAAAQQKPLQELEALLEVASTEAKHPGRGHLSDAHPATPIGTARSRDIKWAFGRTVTPVPQAQELPWSLPLPSSSPPPSASAEPLSSPSPAHQFVTQGLSPPSRPASCWSDLPGKRTLLPLPCTHQALSIPNLPDSCHLPFPLASTQRMRGEGQEGTPRSR